ncbi:MAG: alpha/beta hydrolase [Chloroflexota bacterium]
MRSRTVRIILLLLMVMGFGLVGPQKSEAQVSCSTFEETGQEVCYDFLQYWLDHGKLAQQGYPITGRIQERSETDGQVYLVQYFERAVFELHPENEAPNNVLLSLLGTFRYKEKYPDGAPGQEPNNTPGSVLYNETGKRVGGVFFDYWQKNGGLAQQGLPISDEFTEKSDIDGQSYRVQYFERAVFELHPENEPPYNVLLSQLGTIRKKTLEGTPVNFTTTDGVKLAGSQYGTGSTAVILSAICSPDGKDGWTGFALNLAAKGYMALTYYYRGLGTSGGRADMTLLDTDLHAAIAFARSQGAKKIVLAGGSCGGTISLKASATEKPDAVIVLASPLTLPNIEVSTDELKNITVPKLFAGSADDPFTARIEEMYALAVEPKEKLIYPGRAHATDIFTTEHGDDLTQKLLSFIEKNVPAR